MIFRYLTVFSLLGILVFAGCGGGSKPIADKTRRLIDCRYYEEKNNIGLTAKTLNRVECKRLFGSDEILTTKNPIYPVLIIIDNHCSRNVILSPDNIGLTSTDRKTITSKLHQDTTWENIGSFLSEFSAAGHHNAAQNTLYTADAVSETLKGLETQQHSASLLHQAQLKVHHNIKIDELLDTLLLYEPVIISPYQKAVYCLFVPENEYRSEFRVTLEIPDEKTHQTYTVQMQKHASTWQ